MKDASDAALLRAIGTALYGSRWQATIAMLWSVNPRTVRRRAAGDYEMSRLDAGILREACEGRIRQLQEVCARLDRIAPKNLANPS